MGHWKSPEQKCMGGFNKHGLQSSCQVHKVVQRSHWLSKNADSVGTELLMKLKCSETLACAAQVHLPGDEKLFNIYFDTDAKYFKAFVIIWGVQSSCLKCCRVARIASLPRWVCPSSPGCPWVSSRPALCPPCRSAALGPPPSSSSPSPSAPAERLWAEPSGRTPSDCDSPADSGEKAEWTAQICCGCDVEL